MSIYGHQHLVSAHHLADNPAMGKTTKKKLDKPIATKPKSKRGGPIYKPEFPHLAKQHCILGARNEDLAALFNVSRQSIDKWLVKYPEFKAAVYAGREHADIAVASSLFRRATGYDHNEKHYPADTTACIFWLKNRRPEQWRDKVEVGGKDGGPVRLLVTYEDEKSSGSDKD